MRTIDEIKADIIKNKNQKSKSAYRAEREQYLRAEFIYTVTHGIKLDRLREICEAEADGRLVVLPCKVGDSIWLAMCGQIREYIFMGITQQYGYLPRLYGRQRFGKYEDVGIALVDSIGKTVFLTREEAEAKLKELESELCTRD